MGIDIADWQKLHDAVVNPLVDRVKAEVIPELGQLVKDSIDEATVHLTQEIGLISQTGDKLIAELSAIIQGLDGTTVTVGPIVVPAFSITLHIPRGTP